MKSGCGLAVEATCFTVSMSVNTAVDISPILIFHYVSADQAEPQSCQCERWLPQNAISIMRDSWIFKGSATRELQGDSRV